MFCDCSLEDKITQLTKENEALRQVSAAAAGEERLSLTGSTVTHDTHPDSHIDQSVHTGTSPPPNDDTSSHCHHSVSVCNPTPYSIVHLCAVLSSLTFIHPACPVTSQSSDSPYTENYILSSEYSENRHYVILLKLRTNA